MKRRLVKLVVFLLLGAIVNVAVAWGCATWIDLEKDQSGIHVKGRSRSGSNHDIWVVWRYETTGSLRVISNWLPKNSTSIYSGMLYYSPPPPEPLVPPWADFLRPHHVDQPFYGSYILVADARGWPLLSLWGGHKRIIRPSYSGSDSEIIEKYKTKITDVRTIRAIRFTKKNEPTEWSDHASSLLPLSPLWPGFAINTLFYAVLVWCVTLGPFTARRMIRRQRGRCIKCGYDLRGAEHEVCPECGTGYQSREREA